MSLSLTQWGIKAETVYGTAVVPDRFQPIISEEIEPNFGVTTADDEARNGSLVDRVDQSDPFKGGVSGPVKMVVPTKGFGIYLEHWLGNISTSAVVDSNYTHTGTLSATGKAAKSFTAQVNRPFTAFTNQLFTFEGLVIVSGELSCDVEGFLTFAMDVDGEDHATGGTGVVTYPSYAVPGAAKFPWRLASVTFDAAQVEVKNFSLKVSWQLDVDRRRLRGSELKKQPLPKGKPSIEVMCEPDWSSLTNYNKLAASTITGRAANVVATFDGVAALGGATVPRLQVTVPACRWDKGFPGISGEEPLTLPLTGKGLDDGTNPPVTVTYRTTDATP